MTLIIDLFEVSVEDDEDKWIHAGYLVVREASNQLKKDIVTHLCRHDGAIGFALVDKIF